MYGIIDARELLRYFAAKGDKAYIAFANDLNKGDNSAQQHLAELPSFIAGQYAVTTKTDKRSALKAMEQHHVTALPVVDEKGRFVGMIDRARLTASLIIEVTDQLENATP